MQALFILSLFSLVLVMFSGMAAGLSKNIMQANVEKAQDVKDMFKEVELVLNKVIFRTKDVKTGHPIVDLSNPELTDLSGSILPQYVSYAKSQLEKDRWGKKIFLLKNTKKTIIWGKSSQIAQAPVSTIMLVSAGPNRRYDFFSSLGVEPSETLKLTDEQMFKKIAGEDVIGDDIIVRFNNYEAMLDIWERAENVDIMIKNVALDYFKNMVDAFSPLIQLAQRDSTSEGVLKYNIFDELDKNAVADQKCLDALTPDERTKDEKTAPCYYKNYSAFSGLEDEEGESLTNEWYKKGNKVYEKLIKYRNGKEYTGEFETVTKRKVDPDNDTKFIYKVDGEASNNINAKFLHDYEYRKFYYPTFDVLKNGLDSEGEGFVNLGLSNVKSLDPFAYIDGQVGYSYNRNDSAELIITRRVDGNKDKWTIKKDFLVDALGGIQNGK